MEVAEDGLEHRLRQLLPGGFVFADHSNIEQHKRLPALIRTAI
jgi:hypothetical protein